MYETGCFQKDLSTNYPIFEKAFENNPCPMAITEVGTGCYLHVNDAFCKITGYDRDEIVGKTIFELNIFINVESRKALLQQLSQNGLLSEYEVEFNTKGGAIKYGVFSAHTIESQGYHLILTIIDDITDTKVISHRLLQSETGYLAAFNQAAVGMCDLSLNGLFIRANRKMCEMLGYTEEELLKLNVNDVTHPEDEDKSTQAFGSLDSNEKNSITFEKKCARRDGSVLWVNITYSIIRDANGIPLYINAVIHDITKRKCAETKLASVESNFKTVFETIDDLFFVVNLKGIAIYVNSIALKKLGYTSEECKGLNILDLHPEPFRIEAEQIFADMVAGKQNSCALPLLKKDGSYLPVETRIWLGQWDDEPCFLGISRDSSKEQEAQQKFNKIFEYNPAIMAISSINGIFTDVNLAFLNTLGYFREEVIGKTAAELELFSEPEKLNDIKNEVLLHGRSYNNELKVRTKSGDLLYGLFSGEIIESQGNRHFLSVMKDITEIKSAEEKLSSLNHELVLKSEEIEGFFSVNLDLLCIADQSGKFLRVNKSWENILGYSCEILENSSFLDYVHPEDIPATLDAMFTLSGQKEVTNFVNRYKTKCGQYRYIEWRSKPYAEKIYAAARDITDHILLENQLKEQKEQFELAINGSNDGIWDWNLNTNELFLSARWKELLGYADSEIDNHYDSFALLLHPEDKQNFEKAVSHYLNSHFKLFDTEFRMLHKNGSYRWIWARGEAIRGSDGKINRMAGSHTDITAKKEAERIIQDRERYFRTVIQTTQDGFWVIGEDHRLTYVNEAYCRLSGYTKDELLNLNIENLEINEAPEEAEQKLKRILMNGSEIFETKHRKKDGTIIDVQISASCMCKEPLTVICFCRDFTERKKKDAELAHFNSLMQYIIEHNRSAVAVHDKNLNYMYVSRPYLESYRISEQEVIGKHHYEVFPDLPQRWRDVHQRVLKGEVLSAEEDQYQRQDGTVDWTRWECRPWYESDGSIGGMIVYTEVINERKKMEQMIFNEKEQFRTTLLSVGDGVIATDNQGNITVMNPVAEELTGWKFAEANGSSLEQVFRIVNEYTWEACENPVKKALDSGSVVALANHTILISKSGKEVPIEDSAAPIKNAYNETTGVVLVFRDFTEKREKQKQVEYLSFHDQLTGLYNRRFFEEELKRLDTTRNLPVSMVMLDVNGLKLINDAFGHQSGDKMLKVVADVLRKECRADDIISRIGGDEFIILLPQTDEKGTHSLIGRIKNALSEERIKGIQISVSFGSDTKHESNKTSDEMLKFAEDCMYRDKISDRNSQRYEAIHMIMRTLHEKTPRERQHSFRVGKLCEKIGIAMELNPNEISKLTTAAELHDIGKIAISNEMLDKTGSLTDIEWLEIKRHPEVGYNILSSANAYAPLADIVLAHHERWDGHGYPNELKGEAIPLMSRIIGIADAYDAMTENRPYRKALSKSQAIKQLVAGAGTQFDAELLNVFVDIVSKDI